LIDKIGTVDSVLQDEFGTDKVVIYEASKPFLDRVTGLIGASLSSEIQASLDFSGVKM
jgi:hypothetical protein